jgi:nucleotide-binding universal stress UspA family protein
MFSTIVVGCDGSAHGIAAARFAAALARRFGSRIVVAGAYLHTPHVRLDGSALEELARADAALGAAAGAAAADDTADVRAIVASGATAAAALHDVARSEHADLLGVGTSERRRIAGTQPGSVTEQVLRHSPCPVAVVPPDDNPPVFRRIGVAMDDRAPAREALATAVALAEELREEAEAIVLLHAELPEPQFIRPGMQMPAVVPAASTPEWLIALAGALDAPVPVELLTEVGGAAGMVAARSERVDLVVMGSRDRGAVRRLVMGSVSTYVVRNARCPVVVVPARGAAGRTEAATAQSPAVT